MSSKRNAAGTGYGSATKGDSIQKNQKNRQRKRSSHKLNLLSGNAYGDIQAIRYSLNKYRKGSRFNEQVDKRGREGRNHARKLSSESGLESHIYRRQNGISRREDDGYHYHTACCTRNKSTQYSRRRRQDHAACQCHNGRDRRTG